MRALGTLAAVIMAAGLVVPAMAGQSVTPVVAVSKAGAVKPVPEPMRLTTSSEHVRQLFGQAVLESGNYRLDECLKSLRTATTEDANFAAGWALLAFYATDAREAANALTQAQSLSGRMSPSETLLVRWVGALKQNN